MKKRRYSQQITKPSKSKSSLNRRTARQKRVQKILQLVGYPSSLFGIPGIVYFVYHCEFKKFFLVAFLAIDFFFIAIAAKFISELYNSVLDQIEARLENQTESLATWIVNILESWLLKIWWTKILMN